MENFQNDCCRPWTKNIFEELAFRAFFLNNRKRSGCIVYLSLDMICASKLTVLLSQNRKYPRANIRANFRAK